jgi:arylsulfatase A-like enzyme
MRNLIFITFDSLRWDTFCAADAPFLKSLGSWKKAWTQATYTFPAHMSFFVGKLPQTFDDAPAYDCVAAKTRPQGGIPQRGRPWLRLENPEAPRAADFVLRGKNLAEGFRNAGYATFCTGAVNWFNPTLPAGRYLTESFDEVAFFDGPDYASHKSARKQLAWANERIAATTKPYFLFINFGETHLRFAYEGCPWEHEKFNYGDATECKRRQRACFEFLDTQLRDFTYLHDADLILCADHGEALGEDGLWGHGFYHPSVMEVPMLLRAEGLTE